ncbi:MAG TPA: site-2 protease family protein [Anaerolineaceae bacterium]|jgi:Zn-dependent protease|nr:site-2 protease family protein [Anaerolineaceae bacterium]
MLNLSPVELISRLLTLVIALSLHEYAHARAAASFGDDTPRLAGRLSLNPLRHLDPLGSLMLVVAGFGWAKPVPINPDVIRQRSRAGVMLVSLAGPFTNLLLALLAGLAYRLLPAGAAPGGLGFLSQFLVSFVVLNVMLCVFNLLPVAPLDGEKVLEYLLPEQGQRVLAAARPYGMFILLGLVFVLPMVGVDAFGAVVRAPVQAISRFLLGW